VSWCLLGGAGISGIVVHVSVGVCNESVEEVDDIRNSQGLAVLRRLPLRMGRERVSAERGYPITGVIWVSDGTQFELETRWGLGGECTLRI